MRFSAAVFTCLLQAALLAACATSQQAPVIDRAPHSAAVKTPSAATAAKTGAAEKDWRPEVHVVKKGDTLHSIGLEYGYDYKEVAQKNNIAPPYIIHIGQQLRLPTEAKTASLEEKGAADNGVVITPLKTESGMTASGSPQSNTTVPNTTLPGSAQPATTQPGAVAASGPLLLNSPKALREPYSDQAMATPKPVKTVEAKTPEAAKMVEPGKTQENAKPAAVAGDAAIDWAWPASGKILAGFNDTSAKGIDISGTQGQAVIASAAGKVIYSGSDLRGYGKLVIIKHDKNYLSVYAHNSQIVVKEGQQVSKGQKIAEMGSTDSDRVKLHFEIRRQGKSVDPAKLLPAN